MAEPLLIAGPKRMAEQTWVRAFIRLAGALLLVMALVHLLNAGAYGERLLVFDPLLGIPSRLALLLVAGLELAVALFCFFGGPPGLQAALVAWLAANFLVYRIALSWQGGDAQLGWLRNPMNARCLWSGAADYSVCYILAWLLAGAYAVLARYGFGELALLRRQAARAHSIKMFCPSCGGKIQFATRTLAAKFPARCAGQPLPCERPTTSRCPVPSARNISNFQPMPSAKQFPAPIAT